MEKDYKGYKIIIKQNGREFDYIIPDITEEGYKGRRKLYSSYDIAIIRAEDRIDSVLEGRGGE